MKNKLFPLCAIALTVLCAPSHAQERGVTTDKVVFGMQTDLSGVVANVGVAQSNAIRMRFEEANIGGGIAGRKLELIVEDSGYQVPKAVQAVNKLINRDQVFAIIGSMAAGLNNATIPDQLIAGVPNLFPNAASKSMYEPFHKMKFSGLATYDHQSRAATNWLITQKGAKKICVMYIKNDMGEEVFQAVEEAAKAKDASVMGASHRPTDIEFSASVQRMKEANCDALVLGTLVRDTIGILSAVHAMKWNIPVIGAGATQQPPVVSAPGGIAEGFMAMAQVITAYPDDSNKAAADWVQRYTKRFTAPPNVYAQWAYGWADMTVKALSVAGRNLTMDRFIGALEGTQNYQDIFGSPRQSFGPQRRLSTDESFLVMVKNGRWVKLTEFLPIK